VAKSRANFGSGFGIGAETGRKLSFGIIPVSVRNTAVSFGFGRISGIVSALNDRNEYRAAWLRYLHFQSHPSRAVGKEPKSLVRPSSVTTKYYLQP